MQEARLGSKSHVWIFFSCPALWEVKAQGIYIYYVYSLVPNQDPSIRQCRHRDHAGTATRRWIRLVSPRWAPGSNRFLEGPDP